MSQLIHVTGVSNAQFWEAYAAAGRVGLVGGGTLVEQIIRRAERHANPVGRPSPWSHAFLCEGRRADGCHWVLESDFNVRRKHIRLGAQENRIVKYSDEGVYSAVAVLDFGLAAEQVTTLLREGLELVATGARYSLRELVGSYAALRHPERRSEPNRLAQEHSYYCSAFVQHLFTRLGLDLAPAVADKHTTPEDIAQTPLPHTAYVLVRPAALGRLQRLARRVGQRAKRRFRRGTEAD